MQDLNEDPDEQFRVAVDKVTLKPADSKWDELSGKIISIKRSSLADTIRSKYTKWMMLLALFILLPVAFVFIVTGFNGFHGANAKGAGTAVQKSTTENLNQKSTEPPDVKEEDPKITSENGQSHKNTEAQNGGSVQSKSAAPAKEQTVPPVQERSVPPATAKTFPTSLAQSATFNKMALYGYKVSGTDPLSKALGMGAFDFSNISYSEATVKPIVVGLATSDALSVAPIYAKTGPSVFEMETEPLTLRSNTHENFTLQHLDYPNRLGFYLGLVAGPMLTQVKHQGITKSGFDLGLLAGYALNKKFSIETGLMYTKQYYFVSGPYYNEFARVTYATSLDGSRNTFEIPLTLKYNFIRKPTGNFYISAGASAYIGVNDKVLIHVTDGANPIPQPHQLNYGVTSYLPSYINISVGYEYKIGKFTNIRIEPYLQVPLSISTGNSFKTDLSSGSIQVFNSGIHVVISRFIR